MCIRVFNRSNEFAASTVPNRKISGSSDINTNRNKRKAERKKRLASIPPAKRAYYKANNCGSAKQYADNIP